MPIYDPLAAQFDNRPLAPWQLSKKTFHFDDGFIKWIQKYLEVRKLPCDGAAAKSWINKFKFEQKRYEDCELQWDEYQESLKAPERPSLKPVVSDSGLSGGDLDGANKAGVDGADDAPIEPELPDEFKALEGESPQELQARRLRVLRAKITGMVGKK
jgi:hypothetical protein